MQEPQIRKELAVANYSEQWRWINVHATNDAIQEHARFGRISCWGPERYALEVDARFDFNEVLAWVQAHGEEVSE